MASKPEPAARSELGARRVSMAAGGRQRRASLSNRAPWQQESELIVAFVIAAGNRVAPAEEYVPILWQTGGVALLPPELKRLGKAGDTALIAGPAHVVRGVRRGVRGGTCCMHTTWVTACVCMCVCARRARRKG